MAITTASSASVLLSRTFAASALSLSAAIACSPAGAQSANASPNAFANANPSASSRGHAAGRILVMPRAGLGDDGLDQIVKGNGGIKGRRIGRSELRIVDVPPGLEKQMVDKLSRHPHLKFAELDELVPPSLTTNDPYLGSAWHLPMIGAPAAWDISQGSGVTIAILDTGVDGTHPDLAARMVAGWNAYDNNANASDVHGHGTAVAGTAAASSNNGTGVASVAGQSRIMPVRISDLNGWASWSTVATGLTWAADNGARVANISYGGVSASSAVQSAAQYMRNKGGLVVVAAGNNGVAETYAPTATMITVSATNSSDALASWSSYGSFVSVAAPGDGIWTTNRGGAYGSWWGTSFASPVTAGVVSLMMSANPNLKPAEVENLLYSTAADLGAAGRDIQYGWGRVNAQAAVVAAVSAASSADTQPPSVAITAPLGGSTVAGLVPVDVAASDNKAVVRVDLVVNGRTVTSDSAAPFGFSWDSTQVANGSITVAAVAYDAAGNSATSSAVSVNVSNAATAPPPTTTPKPTAVDTTPPAVSITNPGNGSTVAGNVGIRVTASDDSGSAGISQTLSVDGKVVASATGGALSWNWNSKKSPSGNHVISATARDAAGNAATTSVTVKTR